MANSSDGGNGSSLGLRGFEPELVGGWQGPQLDGHIAEIPEGEFPDDLALPVTVKGDAPGVGGLALAAGKAKELVHVVLCPPHPVHHPPLVVVVVDTEQGVGTPGLPFLCAVTLGHGAAGQAPAVTGGAAIVADDIELVNPGGGVWTLVVEGQEGAVELILV